MTETPPPPHRLKDYCVYILNQCQKPDNRECVFVFSHAVN